MMEVKNTMTAMETPAIAPLDNVGDGEEMADVEEEGAEMKDATGVALDMNTGPVEADDGDDEGEGEGDAKSSTTLSQSFLIG